LRRDALQSRRQRTSNRPLKIRNGTTADKASVAPGRRAWRIALKPPAVVLCLLLTDYAMAIVSSLVIHCVAIVARQ
jgi:hypothetical protein